MAVDLREIWSIDDLKSRKRVVDEVIDEWKINEVY